MSVRESTDVRSDEEVKSVGGPARILLATDGSRGSEQAARMAAELSRLLGSGLYLVHVMPVSSFYYGLEPDKCDTLTIYEEDARRARDLLDRQVRQLEEQGAANEQTDLRTGEPDAEVVALA